ncbi:Predicted metal-dependent phosphohydrolase, HD superfamily [Variovorax sp. HW608]|uniref:HD domain-containing protein n=1 Tax=Variovorax sp. HW608 TaxID=1034889 RepID=UPI00081FF771|nr:N-methyl-D-aspartate receptor NMDAR2C subunit [Variovorax sp. HW608]SCK49885.1 Predicted metal-dependent phosphohydrolase, HD superfamily [Variovorax sp. HW608]
MDEAALHDTWVQAWRALRVGSPDEALLDELLAAHCEAHRAYHTLQHLGECFALLEAQPGSAQRPAEVALALWFHDAVYDVRRHDNEERSAEWARRAMQDAGAAPDAAERVHALVMATRHEAEPIGADARLLVDIDLAILGAPAERFAEYERQIRIEYAHVPAEVFETRRREKLAGFLARDPLYLTAPMRERFEAAARANLKRAVKR